MEWIKCKNDREKLEAIENHCKGSISEWQRRIAWYEAQQESPLDYDEEIHELKTRIRQFEVISQIIAADEFTSVMVI